MGVEEARWNRGSQTNAAEHRWQGDPIMICMSEQGTGGRVRADSGQFPRRSLEVNPQAAQEAFDGVSVITKNIDDSSLKNM